MTDKTILLIDDDADLLQAIARRCRSVELRVHSARNLLTASAIIEKGVPDVVCIDVNMPTGNGLRFCEELAGDPRTAGVPIIVLTGQQDAETRDACQRLQAHFVPKRPDVWAALEPLIRQLVSQPRSEMKPTASGTRPTRIPANLIPPWPATADAGGTGTLPPKQTRQIVVADDDADMVQLLSQRCSSLGCSVIGVNSALEAINVIHRVAPDLVFLDVNMPTGNGLGVCEMMAADERMRTIPVIILTGCADEKTIRRCHDLLVFYVQKGANIWTRVEPLVQELLHLDAPIPSATVAFHSIERLDEVKTSKSTRTASGPSRTVKESAVAGADDESITASDRDGLLDAVFAMLGSDSAPTTVPAEADGESSSTPTQDVPWVLCIDDDGDFSDALRIRLEQHGVAVARAFNGMEGYRLAFSSPASAILLDYNMPNGQGDYVLDRLKNNPVTKNIPVFVITGVKDKVLERRMLAMGAAGFLNKPVDFVRLRLQLARCIDILDAPAAPLAAAAARS